MYFQIQNSKFDGSGHRVHCIIAVDKNTPVILGSCLQNTSHKYIYTKNQGKLPQQPARVHSPAQNPIFDKITLAAHMHDS